MSAGVLLVSADAGVATLRLNRPERRNALNPELRARLAEALADLDRDDTVRVVVLTGSGKAFCAGVDLKDQTPPAGHELAGGTESVSAALARFRKPVIAAINGPAVGGGLELALAADLRIAGPHATFALTEARIGSMPGAGGTQRLPLLVGRAVAMKMLLTGRAIDAQEALRAGLVSDVVADLDAEAHALAGEIARCAPLSLIAIKQAVQSGAPGQALTAGLALERGLWALLAETEDRAEGRAAFREGRAPRFTAR
ncbi:enoyl-CoA hydratase-related protein [Dactylosporangium sp. AC04546]|uniref:enoyl-CoA hydratase/isomerase family protein n=1 Tax=Dactylosporangium sp. AC04546 TaxID=2862460 RepID=UPI001EDE6EFF|nr:enoyl-CoA hydratase-related protein [Dactylosporangium sp. AC04546]WVK78766.1 enoyl-CoA hydratase-related protein [Dactylosporangium sp. AC04546]